MKNFIARISGTKDLTEGKPSKLILNFGLPLLFGLIFQQFYNMVDSVIVGQKLGTDALAAVGSTGSINFMILGFCIGICNGFAIPVAQAYGAKDFKALKAYIINSIWSSVALAAVITVAVSIFTMQILKALRTPSNIIDDAYIYIFIIFLGIPATFLYNLTAGILRSLGDSITPVIFLVGSSIVNIILDLILVVPMGVAGAAVATVASQAVSGIICTIYMTKKLKYLEFSKEDWTFSMRHCLKLCGMGLPMGLQYSITAIGSVILQTAVNDMGSTYVAAVSAGSKISMFMCCPFDAMGSTMATYGGQNVGAGKIDRLGKGIKAAMLIGAVYSVVALVVLYFSADYIALLFVDAGETAIIELTRRFIMASALFYIPLTGVNVYRFCIQGMGFSVFAILAGVFEMLARTLVAILLIPHIGFNGACLANPAAWIAADLFLIPAFIHCCNKLKRYE